MWCSVAIIEPVTEDLPGYKGGQIRGFQSTLSRFASSFTRFYGESEVVEYRMKEGSPHGELRVGDEVYHVEANIDGEVLYETKTFFEGYPELWAYLSQLREFTVEVE